MSGKETPVVFPCADEWLVGMIHEPQVPSRRGVLVVVGGPQYRAGSHRQFLLLARELCNRGVAVMRFDYRGMGDSGGKPLDFMATGQDISAALDAFFTQVPALESVALWGLCDAASGILAYAPSDSRVGALAILNPWVRSEAGLAKTTLREYYLGRLLDPLWWQDMMSGKVNIVAAGRALGATVASVFRLKDASGNARDNVSEDGADNDSGGNDGFIDRMRVGLSEFTGPVLLILSGDDLTAGEFRELGRTRTWRKLLTRSNVTRHELQSANHTFARNEWRAQITEWTWRWLCAW